MSDNNSFFPQPVEQPSEPTPPAVNSEETIPQVGSFSEPAAPAEPLPPVSFTSEPATPPEPEIPAFESPIPTPPQFTPAVETPAAPPKKTKVWLIVLIVVLVLCCCCVLLVVAVVVALSQSPDLQNIFKDFGNTLLPLLQTVI